MGRTKMDTRGIWVHALNQTQWADGRAGCMWVNRYPWSLTACVDTIGMSTILPFFPYAILSLLCTIR